MITFIEGILEEKQPTGAVVNAGGIGYEVLIPLSSYDRLPSEGDRCRLLTCLHIREDAHTLFGFCTAGERDMFRRLTGISGIGPKLALGVLSGLSVRELKSALIEGDVKRLSSISGIGKKTAERMVMEMKDKFSAAEQLQASTETAGFDPADGRLQDAMLALCSLGYKPEQARKMVTGASSKIKPETNIEEIVRLALGG